MARLQIVCAAAGTCALAAVLFALHSLPYHAHAQGGVPVCAGPPALAKFIHPLSRVSQTAVRGGPVTIVAIGSSSTAGVGASSAAAAYPNRLQAMLRARAGRIPVNVLNRGVSGEEIRDMMARFDSNVIAAKPDLVLWQIGTNSVLHDKDVSGNASVLADGLNRLKATGADVVLINPQYAPKVLAKPAVATMVRLIAATAKEANIELFDRFAVMKYWREAANMPFAAFLSPDQLHMNDWGYNCVARLLANDIIEAATRPPVTAGTPVARQ
jgi:lysophospholipase L1-like esterase